MGIVAAGFSMSLDGFIAGPGDDVSRLFQWYFSGEADHEVSSGDTVFKMTSEGAELIEEASKAVGALVTGRRTFDLTHAWGGKHPLDVPVVVVTHRVAHEWVKDGSPFTFVTDGLERAIEQAHALAGDKRVAIGSASITQQCIRAGLLDEIHIDLIPVLLGEGVRLFDHLGADLIELESTQVSASPGVMHLTFRVVR